MRLQCFISIHKFIRRWIKRENPTNNFNQFFITGTRDKLNFHTFREMINEDDFTKKKIYNPTEKTYES